MSVISGVVCTPGEAKAFRGLGGVLTCPPLLVEKYQLLSVVLDIVKNTAFFLTRPYKETSLFGVIHNHSKL